MLAVGRVSSDLARSRDACYALRVGEGGGRLCGASGVSLAKLRCAVCAAPADALGVAELALHQREARGRVGKRNRARFDRASSRGGLLLLTHFVSVSPRRA